MGTSESLNFPGNLEIERDMTATCETWKLGDFGRPLSHDSAHPTVGLLNANPFAEGIANLGFQSIALSAISVEWNVDITFSDTCSSSHPFIRPHASPRNCAILAVSVPFEDTYHHIPRMLRTCGLEPLASKRSPSDPIVIGGGMAMINPMPLAPFFDAIVIGDGREPFPQLLQLLSKAGKQVPKQELLEQIAQQPHIYVPSLYSISYYRDGTVRSFMPHNGAPTTIQAARPSLAVSDSPIISEWTSSHACYSYPDYFSIMASMGCRMSCPFCVVGNCQSGSTKMSQHSLDVDRILQLTNARRDMYGTNLVKLFFASAYGIDQLGSASQLKTLLEHLIDAQFRPRIGSVNIRQVNDDLLGLIAAGGQQRVAFAPEVSESLRPSIGKAYSKDSDLLNAAQMAGHLGLGLDLYTMLGVPGEEPKDLSSLASLIQSIAAILGPGLTVEVSTNPLFTKAQTPFEREPTLRPEESRTRFDTLRRAVGAVSNVTWVTVIPDAMAYYQPILARGGSELAEVIMDVSGSFAPTEDEWRRRVKSYIRDGDKRYFTAVDSEARLPWQHIEFSSHARLLSRRAALPARRKPSLGSVSFHKGEEADV